MLTALLLARLLATALPGARRREPLGGRKVRFTGSFGGSSAHNLETGEFHSVWTGEATHFGISNLEQQAQVTRAGNGLRFSGTWTLTAADGDKLHGTAAGSGVADDAAHATLTIDYTTTGGTGRFARASAGFKVTARHARTAVENGISYGEQQATCEGQLRR